jgi:hypothetical protein
MAFRNRSKNRSFPAIYGNLTAFRCQADLFRFSENLALERLKRSFQNELSDGESAAGGKANGTLCHTGFRPAWNATSCLA